MKRNAPVAELYEDAIRYEGAIISASGALINFSGKKTGRSPKDKRIVFEETSKDDIWWGPVNIKMDEREFSIEPFCPLISKYWCTEEELTDVQTLSRSTVSVPSTTSTLVITSMSLTVSPA